ncbi:hypothetical protein [Erythrobacter sp. WG]|uniref:hypothetical protein n=1 Tax=Erythrobacter sp. WG TaxID=2985510 RepID=UPI0022721764|nr:hypothetical protein [Erythrobacter sp. WG]MCX9147540.1 hypothetical protein [Erythrobacter sp. WG]
MPATSRKTKAKMALLVLIVLGGTLGWLASILARTEAPGDILRQIALGMVVSVTAGEIANDGTMIGSLSLMSLGTALAATGFALVLYHAIAGRKLRSHT